MMINHYDNLKNETNRKEYKATLDKYFSHGGAKFIINKHQSLMYMARTDSTGKWASQLFPSSREQTFFLHCIALIAQHDRQGKDEMHIGMFKGKIREANPVWETSDEESGSSPNEGAEDHSGTYRQSKVEQGAQVLYPHTCKQPPVITHA